MLYCGALNLLLLVFIGAGLLAIAREDGLPAYLCWLCALGPASDGNFIWLGLSGMEHVLFVALSIAAIFFWFHRGLRSAIFAAMCLGALSLVRPEGFLLAVGLAVFFRARRTPKEIAFITAAVGGCVLLFLCVNLKTSHSWLPMTYAGRKWLYFGGTGLNIGRTVRYPLAVFMCGFQAWRRQTHLWNIIAVQFAALGVLTLCRRQTPRSMALCMWVLAVICAYAVMLPALSQGLRYQSVFLCLIIPLMFVGTDALLSSIQIVHGRITQGSTKIVVLSLICLGSALVSLPLWRGISRAEVNVVRETHVKASTFIGQNIPPNAKIAAFDIGVLGYIDGGGRIYDLGGLTDSAYLPYLHENRILDYLDDRHVTYLMWVTTPNGSSAEPSMLQITPEFRARFEKLTTFCIDTSDWDLSGPYQAQCQTIFRRQ